MGIEVVGTGIVVGVDWSVLLKVESDFKSDSVWKWFVIAAIENNPEDSSGVLDCDKTLWDRNRTLGSDLEFVCRVELELEDSREEATPGKLDFCCLIDETT